MGRCHTKCLSFFHAKTASHWREVLFWSFANVDILKRPSRTDPGIFSRIRNLFAFSFWTSPFPVCSSALLSFCCSSLTHSSVPALPFFSFHLCPATLYAIRGRTAKNQDRATGPLACPFARSPLTHLLAPHCSLHSHAPLRSLVHSLTPKLESVFFYIISSK